METDKFLERHVGPRHSDVNQMLEKMGVKTLDELIDQTIPPEIRLTKPLKLGLAMSEYEYSKYINNIASKNKIFKTYIGLGYYNTITPAVIMRNIFENPSWYTSYTPYQAEISQGRLEALINFQTMITSLTGMEIANCSLLDEGTAAAEAMIMAFSRREKSQVQKGATRFFVDAKTFEQTIDVLLTRAEPLGIEIIIDNYKTFEIDDTFFGVLLQYPNSNGSIEDYKLFIEKAHQKQAVAIAVADIMALALLTPPAQWGADVVCGSTQRFGIPMGFGGPHAAYFAVTEKFKRHIPGRIIGVSVDRNGNQALRMALQTREQHIKREKATSNICTAQALLATMAGMYAVYHGPDGIKKIASRIHKLTALLNTGVTSLGYNQLNTIFFDTLTIDTNKISAKTIITEAVKNEINFRLINEHTIGISIDETTLKDDIYQILNILAVCSGQQLKQIPEIDNKLIIDNKFLRTTPILQDKIFNLFKSETELMRYIKKLERKDISLTHSMIPLGSCTMKLNSASSMMPLSNPHFAQIHPFVPLNQAQGYQQLISELETDLAIITGFDAVSLQPNSGAAGEYAGLMVIREYHKSNNQVHRNTVLIPASAHGTNPASAAMAGCNVVVVACDNNGNVDINNLKQKAEEYKDTLHSFMITYPSTHGVFEKEIKSMIEIVHQNGGQVYMDGANMNAQVGLTSPGHIGADVCHLNLHKTFGIPHGGGGPGVGPIAVAKHLKPFLPKHPIIKTGGANGVKAVSSAPYGSAYVLPITHAYIKMLGSDGLTLTTKMAILNANYLVARLKQNFKILYTGKNDRVGHEMIIDCQNFKSEYGIETVDIAKRLMDYGFHAPTLSFPVHETLMVEPTESESKEELDRFIEAMDSILDEIKEIKSGVAHANDNLLKNAPHTANEVSADEWPHPYSRQRAAYPLKWITNNKFWPAVARVDNGFGDRNLVCTCSSISEYFDNK